MEALIATRGLEKLKRCFERETRRLFVPPVRLDLREVWAAQPSCQREAGPGLVAFEPVEPGSAARLVHLEVTLHEEAAELDHNRCCRCARLHPEGDATALRGGRGNREQLTEEVFGAGLPGEFRVGQEEAREVGSEGAARERSETLVGEERPRDWHELRRTCRRKRHA